MDSPLRTVLVVTIVVAAVATTTALLRRRASLATPAQPDPPASWRIYRSQAHGFSLRHPPEWQVVEGHPDQPDLIVGFTTDDTPGDGRINPVYRSILNIRVYPTLAQHPLAERNSVTAQTVADFFQQVPTVAAMGQTTIGGTTGYEFIANDGTQRYGVLLEHRGRIYVLNFERTWTQARFLASTTLRQVLASFQWHQPEE